LNSTIREKEIEVLAKRRGNTLLENGLMMITLKKNYQKSYESQRENIVPKVDLPKEQQKKMSRCGHLR
jgi:hypothetical protein